MYFLLLWVFGQCCLTYKSCSIYIWIICSICWDFYHQNMRHDDVQRFGEFAIRVWEWHMLSGSRMDFSQSISIISLQTPIHNIIQLPIAGISQKWKMSSLILRLSFHISSSKLLYFVYNAKGSVNKWCVLMVRTGYDFLDECFREELISIFSWGRDMLKAVSS